MAVDVGPGRPLVHNHIPKTAGTALNAALIKAMQPKQPYHGVDACAFGSFTDFDQLSSLVLRGVARTPDDIPADADAVFGHIAPATTRTRFAEQRALTILREPRTRLVSHWLFSRAHSDFMLRRLGEWGEMVRLSRRPLATYLSDARLAFYTDNLITRFLVWPSPVVPVDDFIDPGHDDELVAAAVASLAQFDFSGVTEDPEITAKVASWLGRPLEVQRVNEATPMRKGLECDVTAECAAAADLIVARSRIDGRVWDALATSTYLAGADQAEGERQKAFDAALARYAIVSAMKPQGRVARVASLAGRVVRSRR